MIDTLLQMGLSKNEALVYKALVELGPSHAGPLVRKTGKHRQTIYNALEDLKERHLIAETTRSGKNLYAITDPQHIVTDIKQKELAAEELVRSIESMQKMEQEQVEVFTGETSYERGVNDFRRRATEAKEYISIRGEARGWFEHTRTFFPNYVEDLKPMKRDGTDILILFFESDRQKAIEFIGPHLKDPYVCKIAPDEYRLPHTAWLAGDHVYIVTPAADPLVTHIRSKILAEQYREYFWRVWKKGALLENSG